MARASAAQGALIVFEPSSVGDSRLFHEARALTHILKYSHERLGHLSEGEATDGPLLEIETFGEEGLRYRSRLPSSASQGWEGLKAYAVDQVKDAAGAGDWCTAGIIRYDLAILSTKGMSVTAARYLVAELSKQGVTILCLRDFDKTGFSIVHTLRTNTRRWQYLTLPRVFDLGLRLVDVESMGLQSEQVQYDSKVDPRCNLLECGATPEECNFLVKWQTYGGWIGDRVELNAMDSMQFIAWLETKLRAVGVCKVVPDPLTLDTAYRRMIRLSRVQQAIETAIASMPTDDEIAVPADLMGRIYNAIDGTAQSWDTALWQLVRAHA